MVPIALTAARSDSAKSNGSSQRTRMSRPISHVTPMRLAWIILTAACPETVQEIDRGTRSRVSRSAKCMLAKRVALITVAAARSDSLDSTGSR
jgi:hypothetical protein